MERTYAVTVTVQAEGEEPLDLMYVGIAESAEDICLEAAKFVSDLLGVGTVTASNARPVAEVVTFDDDLDEVEENVDFDEWLDWEEVDEGLDEEEG